MLRGNRSLTSAIWLLSALLLSFRTNEARAVPVLRPSPAHSRGTRKNTTKPTKTAKSSAPMAIRTHSDLDTTTFFPGGWFTVYFFWWELFSRSAEVGTPKIIQKSGYSSLHRSLVSFFKVKIVFLFCKAKK